MKTLNLLLGILIGLSILSCSSDTDDNGDNGTNPNPPEETMLVYKKASFYENSVLTSSQEVFYNTDKKVEKVVTKIDNGWRETTLDVEYNGNTPTKLTKTIDYGSSDDNDTVEEFNITFSDGQIFLYPVNGADYQVQIGFTGEYVDHVKVIQPSTNILFKEDIFQRNADNNITSHVISDDNMTFTYSNYDVGKVMPFHREYSIDYLIVFGLKPSEKLPLTETHENTDYSIDPSELVYDSNNNIIREGNDMNYTEFDYVEI